MTEIFAPYKWEALFARWPDILAAFGMTAAISALALVIALVLGFVFGVFAVSRFRILRALTRVYVETVQNIPLLLQVFVLYAVFPLIGLTIASFWIGVIAIGALPRRLHVGSGAQRHRLGAPRPVRGGQKPGVLAGADHDAHHPAPGHAHHPAASGGAGPPTS